MQYNPYPYNSPFINPFQPQVQQQAQQPVQVVRVNGRNGAEAFNLGPNSSALLLDASGAIVWLVTSDGAGYKTVAPYDITPHQDAPPPDYGNLETRIKKLEEMMNEYSANSSTAAKSKPAGEPGTD